MSHVRSVRNSLVSLCLLAAAAACGDSAPAAPNGGNDPLEALVQHQSPDTTAGGAVPAPQGDGYFRGSVVGYSEADFPDTLKSAKPIANAAVTAYPATLTNADPKLGPPAASVRTGADGQFTFPTLKGGLYVVTFVPPAGDPHKAAWTQATANPQSGDRPWIIMLGTK